MAVHMDAPAWTFPRKWLSSVYVICTNLLVATVSHCLRVQQYYAIYTREEILEIGYISVIFHLHLPGLGGLGLGLGVKLGEDLPY